MPIIVKQNNMGTVPDHRAVSASAAAQVLSIASVEYKV